MRSKRDEIKRRVRESARRRYSERKSSESVRSASSVQDANVAYKVEQIPRQLSAIEEEVKELLVASPSPNIASKYRSIRLRMESERIETHKMLWGSMSHAERCASVRDSFRSYSNTLKEIETETRRELGLHRSASEMRDEFAEASRRVRELNRSLRDACKEAKR